MKTFTRIWIAIHVFILGLCPTTSFAFDSPSEGAFLYNIYDLFVNDILKGPIGWVIAGCLILAAIFFAIRSSIFGTLICALCAGVVVKIEEVVQSLGIQF